MTRKDWLTDPSFDPVDLENRLEEIEADVEELVSNLPVEVLDGDDEEELEGEYPEDFDDAEELEDEVVECEELVEQARALLARVRAHYLPVETPAPPAQAPAPAPSPQASSPEGPVFPSRRRRKKRQSLGASCLELLFYALMLFIAVQIVAILQG
ncbi:MAG: hypothetical protein J5771_07165 [Bacteroidales bacterium]|nr:hypothetical protein [Bacteroidales bacterium]